MANSCVIPNVLKRSKFDNNSMNILQRKNILNGLHNALNILYGLERCFRKSSKYEKELFRCKSSHRHAHSFDGWWQNDPVEEKDPQFSQIDKKTSSRSQVDLMESWSTMSIVCMQYQYEELSKRYEALLQAYDERCGAINERDRTIARMQSRMTAIGAQLVRAHKSLLSVGEKYLTLRRKHLIQKQLYEERLETVKSFIEEMTPEEQRFDPGLESEHEVDTNLLMSQIHKCNTLFLENLYLKTQMEDAVALGSF